MKYHFLGWKSIAILCYFDVQNGTRVLTHSHVQVLVPTNNNNYSQQPLHTCQSLRVEILSVSIPELSSKWARLKEWGREWKTRWGLPRLSSSNNFCPQTGAIIMNHTLEMIYCCGSAFRANCAKRSLSCTHCAAPTAMKATNRRDGTIWDTGLNRSKKSGKKIEINIGKTIGKKMGKTTGKKMGKMTGKKIEDDREDEVESLSRLDLGKLSTKSAQDL